MNIAVLLQGAVFLLWVLVIGMIILAVVRAGRGLRVGATSTTIIVLAVAAIILTIVSAGLVFVQPEDRGVVISAIAQNGVRQQPLDPGLHWIIPFFENVKTYPISHQTYTMSKTTGEGQVQGDDSITARTADGQEVFIDASVIYSVDPAQVVKLHIQWQNRYMDELIRPVSRGAIRDAISQYGIEQVVTSKRAEISQKISDDMTQKFSANGLNMYDFVLRNITFSPEYAASVEQKQISEQQAQQAKFVVEQRKQEAEQARQVAQGQADALKDNPDLLTYNYISKLSPGIQVMLVPNNSPYLLPNLPTLVPPTTATGSGASVQPTQLPVVPPTLLPTPVPTATPR